MLCCEMNLTCSDFQNYFFKWKYSATWLKENYWWRSDIFFRCSASVGKFREKRSLLTALCDLSSEISTEFVHSHFKDTLKIFLNPFIFHWVLALFLDTRGTLLHENDLFFDSLLYYCVLHVLRNSKNLKLNQNPNHHDGSKLIKF